MIPSNFPKQKISKSEKTQEWAKKCADVLIESSTFGSSNRSKLIKMYELYNGKMDTDTYYSYVENPLGSQRAERKAYPAKIRNYNIIKPVVDLLVGEKSKRPNQYTVICVNPDVVTEKERVKSEQVKQLLEQQFVNRLNELGVPTGQDSKEVPAVEEFIKDFDKSYKDGRAINGQEALNYIEYSQKLDNKFIKGFFDYCITGYVYSYKGVKFDNVEYSIISPLFLDYGKSADVEFVEDSDWAVRYCPMSVNQVVDNFHDILKDEDIDSLESSSQDTGSVLNNLFYNNAQNSNGVRIIDTYHITWKTFQRVGILKYIDELGMHQELEVSEDYIAEENESIEWFYKNIVYHMYKIGDIYTEAKPFPVQREDGYNRASVKLPYNGRAYSDRHAENISVVSMGINYQVLYNIFHYRLELSIARNKDKVMLMEYNAIPRQHGWEEEDFLYNMDAHSIAMIDTTSEGSNGRQVNFNQFQVLDMSLWNYISKQYELLRSIKDEWEDSMGITRQRKGNILASDGKSNTERAVFQSSVISEEFFRKYEEFEESELNGLLDTSRFAWVDQFSTSYSTKDYRTAFISVDPVTHANSKFGVFATKSGKEMQRLETLRQYGFNYASNTKNPQFLTEMLNSDNFSQIKVKFDEMIAAEREYEQSILEKQNETKQLEIQDNERERMFKAEEAEKERDLKRELKAMDIDALLFGSDINNNGTPDINEIEKRAFEREKYFHDLRQKAAELESDKRLRERELDIKEKDIESKERIAKQNKNKYDK